MRLGVVGLTLKGEAHFLWGRVEPLLVLSLSASRGLHLRCPEHSRYGNIRDDPWAQSTDVMEET